MKLIFDQNLPPKLVPNLADFFPDSIHVREVGLGEADDESIWEYAREKRLTIVSKDSDFHQRSFLFGHPPKVVWLRLGNCPTAEIEAVLRERHQEIFAFGKDKEASFLIIE